MKPFISFVFIAFLGCLTLPACKQNTTSAGSEKENSAEADSLMSFLKVQVNDAFNSENSGRALKLLDSIAPVVDKNGSPRLMNNFLRFKATYYSNLEQYDSATHYINLALLQSQDSSMSRERNAATLMMANILRKTNHLDSALRYAREAYVFAKENDTGIYPVTCLHLAEIYNAIGDVQMNGKYLLEGFAAASNPRLRRVLANNITRYYDNIDRPDSTLSFFRKNVLPDTLMFGPGNYGNILQNYGVLLQKNGDVNTAIQMYDQAMSIYRKHRVEDDSYTSLFFNLAGAHRKAGRYLESNAYLDSSLHYMAHAGQRMQTVDVLKLKAANYAHLNQHQEAYVTLDTAYDLFEQEVDSSIVIQARELETKYQVQAKDNEIKSLSAANASVRKISTLQRILLLVTLVIIVLVIAFGIVLYRRRNLKEQLKQTELEQRLLRSQMEPHFIFNTLSTLQSLIRNNENRKSVKYLNQFARLLRLTLENSREPLVLLQREVEALNNYMSLQAMRFEDIFEYEIDIYEGYEEDEVYIPPMMLQPFVENAIQYGVQNLEEKGRITVSIRKGQGILTCIIADNGHGLQDTPPLSGKQSLSTAITRERLAILAQKTGKTATLDIRQKQLSSGQPGGVEVQLCIPYAHRADS